MKNALKTLYLLIRIIALSIIGLFIPQGPKIFSAGDISKILVIRIDRLGDFVLTTPLIRALAASLPRAEISMMTSAYTSELAKNLPCLKNVIVYDGKKKQKRWLSKREFARGFKGRFDLIIDPLADYTLETALLSYWIGAPFRLGFDVAGRGVFFNIKAKPRKEQHFIDQSLHLLEALGLETPAEKEPKITLSAETRKRIDSFLLARGIGKEEILIGIHPGGYYPSQRWMTEGFAAVAEELGKRDNTKIVLMAGKGEEEIAGKTTDALNVKPVLWDGEGIDNLAGILGRCRLLICNNSGPLHLAVGLGVPTVSTMGPTVPWMWWPRGDKHIVIRKDLPCSPCNRGKCRSHECMKLIEPSEIIEAAEKLL